LQDTNEKIRIGEMRKIIRMIWPFCLSALVFLCVKIASGNSGFVEHYYSEGIYPLIAKSFSAFSRLIPFSLWDCFWIVIIILVLTGLVLVVIRKIKIGWFLLRILQTVALLYSLFYIVWGFNYFRPRIEARFGWKIPKADEIFFSSILDSIITETNRNYISLSQSEYPLIDKLVEDSYRRHSSELGINYPNGTRRPKTMLFSSLYSKMGLSGYFGPFFNEIHLNYYLLPMDYPFVLAHEKAHQFGITSEAEANFTAFVICVKSDDQRLKYSGYLSLLLYFLRDASHMAEYKDFINKVDKNVISDIRYRQKYYQDRENQKFSEIQSEANDVYLKANKIKKGVKNYNEVVSLVLDWYYNSNSD
jgi:hypothetical protein